MKLIEYHLSVGLKGAKRITAFIPTGGKADQIKESLQWRASYLRHNFGVQKGILLTAIMLLLLPFSPMNIGLWVMVWLAPIMWWLSPFMFSSETWENNLKSDRFIQRFFGFSYKFRNKYIMGFSIGGIIITGLGLIIGIGFLGGVAAVIFALLLLICFIGLNLSFRGGENFQKTDFKVAIFMLGTLMGVFGIPFLGAAIGLTYLIPLLTLLLPLGLAFVLFRKQKLGRVFMYGIIDNFLSLLSLIPPVKKYRLKRFAKALNKIDQITKLLDKYPGLKPEFATALGDANFKKQLESFIKGKMTDLQGVPSEMFIYYLNHLENEILKSIISEHSLFQADSSMREMTKKIQQLYGDLDYLQKNNGDKSKIAEIKKAIELRVKMAGKLKAKRKELEGFVSSLSNKVYWDQDKNAWSMDLSPLIDSIRSDIDELKELSDNLKAAIDIPISIDERKKYFIKRLQESDYKEMYSGFVEETLMDIQSERIKVDDHDLDGRLGR